MVVVCSNSSIGGRGRSSGVWLRVARGLLEARGHKYISGFLCFIKSWVLEVALSRPRRFPPNEFCKALGHVQV